MNNIELKVVKTSDNVKLPSKPTVNSDSGFDIYAYELKKLYIPEGTNGERKIDSFERPNDIYYNNNVITMPSNSRALIDTGIKSTIGEGYELQIRPRSGLSLKKGLTVTNTPGTIDAEYRNTIGVILHNTSNKEQTIEIGDAIAQMVPVKIELPKIKEVDNLDETIRGESGYGSSDKKGE